MNNEFQTFIVGAGLNFAVAVLIVRFIYCSANREKSFVFSFLIFSTVIYFVLQFLASLELSIGFGFGLFAVFSVLRYRTDDLPLREMTYLFTVIGIAVMNSFLSSSEDLMKLLVANGSLVTLLYVLEKEWGFHFETSKKLTYEKIELIKPANAERLMADLRERTGLPVKRVDIGRIDFLRDTAEISIHYEVPRVTAAKRQKPLTKESRLHDVRVFKDPSEIAGTSGSRPKQLRDAS